MKVSVAKVDTFQSTAKFKQSPFTQENYLQVDRKFKSKSARIITERKNGYVRKYLVKEDGTKTLISELRLEDKLLSPQEVSKISKNSKTMLDVLNASSTLKSIQLKD